MISYNAQILNPLLTSLSEIVDANISVYDNMFEGGIINNYGNKSKVCTELHNIINNECKKSDITGFENCLKVDHCVLYRCHLGFKEIIIPFNLDHKTKIFILVGPFLDDESIQIINKRLEDINYDNPSIINKYLEKVPYITEAKFHAINDVVTSQIDYAQRIKLISIEDNFVESKLDPYLNDNLSKDIYVDDLVKTFFYSQKQLETIIKDYSGLSTKKYITKFKVNAAKTMLITTNKPLQAVAQEVGFYDYNYFIKVFKSICNDTPLQFRKKYANKPH